MGEKTTVFANSPLETKVKVEEENKTAKVQFASSKLAGGGGTGKEKFSVDLQMAMNWRRREGGEGGEREGFGIGLVDNKT